MRRQLQRPPFKLMLVSGRNWVFCPADEAPKRAFKAFHGKAPERGFKILVVPEGYGLINDGLNSVGKTWEPVQVFPVERA